MIRIGLIEDLPIVFQPVAVAIRPHRIQAILHLVPVRQAIHIAVGRAVVRVVAARRAAAQTVAVGVGQRREAGVPRQRVTAIAPVGQLVEPIQRVWKDIEDELVAQINGGGICFLTQLTGSAEHDTFLNVDRIAFEQIERRLPVNTRLRQRDGRVIFNVLGGRVAFGISRRVAGADPFLFHFPKRDRKGGRHRHKLIPEGRVIYILIGELYGRPMIAIRSVTIKRGENICTDIKARTGYNTFDSIHQPHIKVLNLHPVGRRHIYQRCLVVDEVRCPSDQQPIDAGTEILHLRLFV